MESKPKKCKGTGVAVGYGCGQPQLFRRFGLGMKCRCYRNWLLNTESGHVELEKSVIRAKKKISIESKKKNDEQKRELNTSGAMKTADIYFSRYIRLENSIDGNCTCYTCGKIIDIKEAECGHYIKREHKATRYDEDNARPQCRTCNGDTKHNGKQVEFRINLINEIGLKEVEALELRGRQNIKADTKFFRDKGNLFRERLNELQKQMKVKYW